MSALNLTSVDLVVIVVCLVFGYLVVSHFLGLKQGAFTAGGSAPSPDPADAEGPLSQPGPGFSPPIWVSVLGVPSNASPDQVRRAYRTQIAKYHPDKVAALGDEFKLIADRKSKEINAAYAEACRDLGMS